VNRTPSKPAIIWSGIICYFKRTLGALQKGLPREQAQSQFPCQPLRGDSTVGFEGPQSTTAGERVTSIYYLIPFRLKTGSYDPGRPATSWKGAHEEICAAAGINIRIYDFRHSCITRMLESGVPEGTVMAVCGHVSRAMIARYSHVQMKSKLAAVQRILGEPGTQASDDGKEGRRKVYLRVMVSCPASRKLVFTGTAAEEKEFQRDATRSGQFTCPECKQVHTWTKPDAFLLP
jgi:Phage integrase family